MHDCMAKKALSVFSRKKTKNLEVTLTSLNLRNHSTNKLVEPGASHIKKGHVEFLS